MRSMACLVGMFPLLTVLVFLGPSPTAVAQETEQTEAAKQGKGVEEIIVTGRKREEALQDTPTSIRAFSSMELEHRSVDRVDEIGKSVANMVFDATDGSNYASRIYIRGVGQDSSGRLVDPGVGTYVDGVYIPRSFGGLLSLIDVDRIEVLRGPQGTLYGKNTVGGVVNLISTPPGMDFGGYGRIKVGNYDTLETRGAVDIPVNIGPFREKLYTRLSVATATDDGWTKNVAQGLTHQTGDNKLLGGRFSLRALPTDSLTIDLIYDRTREYETERVRHCIPGDPINLARFLGDNLFDLGGACARSTQLSESKGFAFPPAKLEPDSQGTNLTVTWDISENVTLKSISSWRHLDFRSTKSESSGADPEVSPASTLDLFDLQSLTQAVTIPNGGIKQQHDAWSQEFQLNGTAVDGRLRYVGGLFWFEEKGHTRNIAALPRFYYPDAPLDLGPPGCCFYASPGQPRTDFTAVARDMQRELMTADIFFRIVGPLFTNPAGLFDPALAEDGPFLRAVEDLTFTAFTEFENISYAGYVNFEYDLTQKLTAEVGLRRTQERKDSGATEINFFSGDADFGAKQDKRFSSWSPMAKLTYRFNDDLLAYLGWARGWKSGGFNSTRAIVPDAISAQQTPDEARLDEFDPEDAYTWEAGLKSSWLDNRLVVNVSAFYNTYKDIQLAITQADERGLASTGIKNAAKATIYGAELEVTALPFEGLTLTLGLGHTNAEYENFTVARANPISVPCANLLNSGVFGQRVAGADPIDLDDGFLDLSGAPFFYPFPVPIGFASLLTGGFIPDDPRVVSLVSVLLPPLPADQAGQCPAAFLAQTFGILASRTFSNTSFDDKHFKFTPAYTLNASATYSFDVLDVGTLSLRADWYARAKTYFDVANDPGLTQSTYGLLDVRATLDLADGMTSISFWGKNMLDRVYIDGTTNLRTSAGFDQLWWGWPRRYGVEVTRRF